MEFICRRCTRITNAKAYRVTTKDKGVIMLNMVVCPSCARLAKSLGLPTMRMAPVAPAARAKDARKMSDAKQRRIQSPAAAR